MGWRWWLRVGMNETPRMRPSWWAWQEASARFGEAVRALGAGIGEQVLPALVKLGEVAADAAEKIAWLAGRSR